MESQSATSLLVPIQQENENGNFDILFLDASNFVMKQSVSDFSTSSNPLELQILSIDPVPQSEKSVFVCSLCQKFSQKENIILTHIKTSHFESLLMGTPANKFVTRLQALQYVDEQQTPRKRGRPKKCDKQKLEQVKPVPQPEPVAASDGFFWCQKCYKYFNKSRQLMSHVCLESDEQRDDTFDLDSDEEKYLDTDNSKDFKMHMDIDNLNQFASMNCSKRSFIMNQVDTSYHLKEEKCNMPIFSNEHEKSAFEEHIKNVDFSCIEHLITKQGKKCQKRRKKSCKHDQAYVYSCEICKKVFKSLSHIRMHCLTHTTLKPFTCLKCSYSTNSKGNLYIHMRKHTGNIFRCSYCEFQSGNRSHIVEHEATHLDNSQSCELCHKTYKTVKSLINHVRMYHKNYRGKKYLSGLTWKSKHGNIMGNNDAYNSLNLVCIPENNIPSHINRASLDSAPVIIANEQPLESPDLSQSQKEIPCDSVFNSIPQDPKSGLFEKINDNDQLLLLCEPPNESQKAYLEPPVLCSAFRQSHSNECNAVSNRSSYSRDQEDQNLCLPHTASTTSSYLINFPPKPLSKNGALQFSEAHYQNTIPENGSLQFPTDYKRIQYAKTSVLENCLQEATFSDASLLNRCEEVSDLIGDSILEQCTQLCHVDQVFRTSPLLEKGKQIAQSLLPAEAGNESQLAGQSHSRKYQEEAKSAETKLFEKCRRLQAYVCCVCASIFIDPVKLKDHLKEHASEDSSYNNLVKEPQEQHFESKKTEEIANPIADVCDDLSDSLTEEQMFDKHLEKLYTSSLDMSWYLPELKVSVEYDPNLFDSVLEDSSNFPINEKYDANEELHSKATEENMLKYFEEI